MGEWTLEDIAEAVHRGRFPSDREATLFEHEDRAGRDYCLRIARSVAAMLSTSPVPEKEGGDANETEQCRLCQGSGEVVSDWSRYLSSEPGDKGDEGTVDCPDCLGTGLIEAPDATATPTDTGATVDGGALGEIIAYHQQQAVAHSGAARRYPDDPEIEGSLALKAAFHAQAAQTISSLQSESERRCAMTFDAPDEQSRKRAARIVEASRAMLAEPDDIGVRQTFVRATFNLDWTAAAIVTLANAAAWAAGTSPGDLAAAKLTAQADSESSRAALSQTPPELREAVAE